MYRDLILLNELLLLLFISVFCVQSDATSVIHIFRQLATQSQPLAKPQIPLQLPPSPSPSAAPPVPFDVPAKPKNETVATQPKTELVATQPKTEPVATRPKNEPVAPEPKTEPVAPEPKTEPVAPEPKTEPVATDPKTEPVTCDGMSKKCHFNSLTACLGLDGSSLSVLNDGDSSLKVNVTVLPVNTAYKDIKLPRHQAQKINISDSVVGSSSIVLDAGNGHCIIQMGAVVPKDKINIQFPSLDAYITPINGAYVLIASALIIGGTWTCFKFWKKRPHTDGVPYQELEMGQSDLITSVNVESAEDWDQNWGDDWDDEKGVKSFDGNPIKSSTGNGNVSRSSISDGWRNDWDD